MLIDFLRLLRIKDWVKNFFVIAPLVFSGEFLNINSVFNVLIVMIFFCITSSAVYIFNDIHDHKADRLHPKKSQSRPLAMGRVSVTYAFILFSFLVILMSFCWFFNEKVTAVMFIYLIIDII